MSITTMHGRDVSHPYDQPCRELCSRAARTIARSDGGGSLIIEAITVHAYECPYWREGRRHGPCVCGALALWQTHYDEAIRRVAP